MGTVVRRQVMTLLLASLAMPIACSSPRTLMRSVIEAQQAINQAREVGAVRCAGADLARAESHLEFMRAAIDRADLANADYHGRIAMLSSSRACATARNNPCCSAAGPDRDGDGVVDTQDQCPDEPEDKDGFQDQDGCPDPDNDADTILDAQDQCPNEPGDVAHAGCPAADRDHDGIADAIDQCPDIPEDIDGVADGDGCPEAESLDLDHDGIDNAHDACPTQAEDKDGFQDEDGCPDPDNDLDTVLDADDLCPSQAGPPALRGCPPQDRDGDSVNDDGDQCPDVAGLPPSGCPRKVLVSVSAEHIDIKQQINFMAGKAAINKNDLSLEIINQVASALQANPTLKIMIEGHTDGNGPAARNLVLSDDRAQAVRKALINRGVDGARLEAVGYGESRPIAPNKTPKGRAKNRRVVFTIVSGSAPTAPPVAPSPPYAAPLPSSAPPAPALPPSAPALPPTPAPAMPAPPEMPAPPSPPSAPVPAPTPAPAPAPPASNAAPTPLSH